MFYDKGYNILMYDHRYHGRSEGENCTLGYYEKYDLKDLVTWVLRKVGKNSIVGIHGESMGASTAIMHSAIDNRTKFTIADCPFQDVRFQFKHRLKVEYNVPAFPILNVIGIFNKIITGVSYRKISPIKITPLITTPILYIHGDMDDFTLPINSVNLYKATKCKKKIYLAKNAKHAKSITTNPKVYKKIVFNFIDTIS
ncbi:MAG: hypothetical protein ATN32_03825 [Candidatus Epulonipiscium fishelsonii]|nr:MAG: hypothetical protein ATN32_03825 [Epulopiscium sp. AS2M-Bin002]